MDRDRDSLQEMTMASSQRQRQAETAEGMM